MRQDIIAGLDVGTTKVCSVVAELNGNRWRILGVGSAPSTGIRKGIVINIDATVDSIKKAVKEAEASSGTRIKSVHAAVSGSHIRGFDSSGAVGIRGKEVEKVDVGHAVDSAKAVYIPLDREVLHVIPTEFVLDGQDGITDPIGMAGVRLEARVHIVTAGASAVQNLAKCCEKAELSAAQLVFGPIASAGAVLTADEKEFGVVLVDIGGGTTDVALFRGGKLRHAAVIGTGGVHVTNDIAVGLRVGMPEAERLKKESGAAYEGLVAASEEMTVMQGDGQGRTLPRKYIAEIIQPRCDEMLELIKDEIKRCSGYETAVCGVVLTGGASMLAGFDRMAESVLGMPVRIGTPWKINGLQEEAASPLFATGVGLVACEAESRPPREDVPSSSAGILGELRNRAKDVLKYVEKINSNIRKKGENYV